MFERALWASRYIIVVAVAVIALSATGVVVTTTVAAVGTGREMMESLRLGAAGTSGDIQPFGAVLQIVEGYL